MKALELASQPQRPWYRNADILDIKVVRLLAKGLRLTDAQVRDEILSRKASSVSATYQLLLMRKQSGQGLPHFAPDILAEKWPRRLGACPTQDSHPGRLRDRRQWGEGAMMTTEQIKAIQESASGQSTDASALPIHLGRSSVTKLSNSSDQPDSPTPSPYNDQFENLPKCRMRNYQDSPSTKRLSKQKALLQTSPPSLTSTINVTRSNNSTSEVFENSTESYKEYLEKLRRQKHKLYKGVLKTIGNLQGVPQGYTDHASTFQNESTADNEGPSEWQDRQFSSPRQKSAGSKSVRFAVVDDGWKSTKSYPQNDNAGQKKERAQQHNSARLREKSKKQSVAPEEDFIVPRPLRVMSAVELDSVHAPPITNCTRPYSSMSLVSGKTSASEWMNTDASSIPPMTSQRQHHVFKVKDGVSDKLFMWDLGMVDLKMAGEKISSERRSLPEIPKHQKPRHTPSPSISLPSATKMQRKGFLPTQRWSFRDIKNPHLQNSLVGQEEPETGAHSSSSSDVTTNLRPRRHRYSIVTSPIKSRDEQAVDQGYSNKVQLHVHIPTGDERNPVQKRRLPVR